MMIKPVALIGGDAAPSACFKRLEPALRESGLRVDVFAGEGRPINNVAEAWRIASGAGLVVLGMSSSPNLAKAEIRAGDAAKNAGVPYGFYGDVPNCFARARSGAWFEHLAADAAFYFAMSEEDAAKAKAVFPNAEIYVTGNPLREDMAFPRFTKQEVRAKLSVQPDEKIVLAAGGKFAAANMASWALLMDVLSRIVTQRFKLVIGLHPGDRTPFAFDQEAGELMHLYKELVHFSPVPATILDRSVLSTPDAVSGADIVVEFGTSIGIAAAYQRIPVIGLGLRILFKELDQTCGMESFEAWDMGFSEVHDVNAVELAKIINDLLTPEGFASMRARQEEVCVQPTERGAAIRRMVEAIESEMKAVVK